METEIENFISKQDTNRQSILKNIHKIIIAEDHSVSASIEPMMGREMIIYKKSGLMKYGLGSTKNYMSFHILPIYGSATLHAKYKLLLTEAKFQKGCINFEKAEEMPLEIIEQLINECSEIDLHKIREEYLNSKKTKSVQ